MNRRSAVLALILGLLADRPARTARAQQAAPMHRIGMLTQGPPSGIGNPSYDVFLEGMRDLGWRQGQNLVVDHRGADGNLDRLPGLAAELVRLNVAVIVTSTGNATIAAKRATDVIPIVMMSTTDPVGQALVASLARPGGNVTGLTFGVGVQTFGKQLEMLKEVLPGVRRVAVLVNASNRGLVDVVGHVKATAQSLGVQLQVVEAREANQLAASFDAMTKGKAQAVVVLPDPMFNTHRASLAELSARTRLPAIYGQRVHVEAGGLMSYGPNLLDNFRRAAFFVDKILKGSKPADLPVEQPTRFELVINMKTAKALDVTIPQSLRLRADEVIS